MPMGALSVSYAERTARPSGESTRPDVALMGLTSRGLTAGRQQYLCPDRDAQTACGVSRSRSVAVGVLRPALARRNIQRCGTAPGIVGNRPGRLLPLWIALGIVVPCAPRLPDHACSPGSYSRRTGGGRNVGGGLLK
jgi:hypothetical protein